MAEEHHCRHGAALVVSIHYLLLIRFIFVVTRPAWQVLGKHLYNVLPRKTVACVEYSEFTVQDLHVFIKREKPQILVNYIHLNYYILRLVC